MHLHPYFIFSQTEVTFRIALVHSVKLIHIDAHNTQLYITPVFPYSKYCENCTQHCMYCCITLNYETLNNFTFLKWHHKLISSMTNDSRWLYQCKQTISQSILCVCVFTKYIIIG